MPCQLVEGRWGAVFIGQDNWSCRCPSGNIFSSVKGFGGRLRWWRRMRRRCCCYSELVLALAKAEKTVTYVEDANVVLFRPPSVRQFLGHETRLSCQ